VYALCATGAFRVVQVLKTSLEMQAKSISAKIGVEVIAAYDGMKLEL